MSIPRVETTTSPTGTTASGSTPAAAAPVSNTLLDREAFLKLLVAQLKYQDPSKPLDATEMVSQSAQLSVVDKLAEISSTLSRSAATDRLSLAGSIVGKQIAFAGPDGEALTAVAEIVRFDGDEVVVTAGEWDVPLDAVMAVAGAPVAPAPTSPAATAPDSPPATAPDSPPDTPPTSPPDTGPTA